jgi:hypothetical protein
LLVSFRSRTTKIVAEAQNFFLMPPGIRFLAEYQDASKGNGKRKTCHSEPACRRQAKRGICFLLAGCAGPALHSTMNRDPGQADLKNIARI